MNNVDLKLIKKYNVQGPRYTSYPTAVQFDACSTVQKKDLARYLDERNREPRRVSLYVHIPFCFSLCWYCGCTKVITRDQNRGDVYLDYLEKEIKLVAQRLHPESIVIQVHFGGGTPTFLTPAQLLRLGEIIHSNFRTIAETEFGVEIDPRRCTPQHIAALKHIGCNRASLGVQDTNPGVQQAIHRIQPFEQTRKVTNWLRAQGIHSVNFDLIYGLPKQNLRTFRQSMEDVLSLNPDRLAVYSYAHIPRLMPAQKLLNADDMPATDEKLAMLQLSISYLTNRGYRFIGMDHFSRKDEELSKAMDDGTLQRNFQGYSTHSGADLYAFGMSGISNVGDYYWQSPKDLSGYYEELNRQELPVAKIMKLSPDDRIRQDIIMTVMCKHRLSFNEKGEEWNINFREYFEEDLLKLGELEDDGLVHITRNEITITEKGRLFLRNIAMCFDAYVGTQKTGPLFSKTV